MLARWQYRLKKLRVHPAPLRVLASRVLWHTRLSPLFTAKLPGGMRVRFYPSSMSAALWSDPAGRSEDASVVRSVLRPGDTYVDCGANIGQLALVAVGQVGAMGRVVAIEANPRIARYLRGNLQINEVHDVRVVVSALGASDEKRVWISDRRDDDQNRIGDVGVEVPLRTLDSLIEPQEITLLKLDVEGYELNVLRGAGETLKRTRVVYCELSAGNCARYDSAPADVERLLLGAGFSLRCPATGLMVEREVFAGLAPNELPATGYNLLAVGPRHGEWLSKRLREAPQLP